MERLSTLLVSLVAALLLQAQTDYTNGLSVWFDQPTTLKGRVVWHGGRPDLWKGKTYKVVLTTKDKLKIG